MNISNSLTSDPVVLLEVIRTQTEIAKLGVELGAVMSLAADSAQRLTKAGGAIVELARGGDMIYGAATGLAKSQLGLRLQREGSLSGLCVEKRQIMRCDDTETDPRVNKEACRLLGLRSMVVAPLDHDGTTVGVLKIASSSADAFGDREVAVLEVMTGLIAAAMFHAARNETSELYHRATHDSLTGLANRALFYDRLRQRLALGGRQSTQFGILNLDMDGLKLINDGFGHRAGDSAIRETARRIRNIARQADTVARLGGDEFAVILSDIRNRDSAILAADRITTGVRAPFQFEGHLLPLDVSIGIAIYPEDGQDIDSLTDTADRAMYAVKRARKSN